MRPEVSIERMAWQRMWGRAQGLGWRTLALVPGDDSTSTLEVANLIARLSLEQGDAVHVADMRALRPKSVHAFLDGMRLEAARGTRIVIATRSTATSMATAPIARAADCAILCASIGSTSLVSIKETVAQIGRRHFLGSLLVSAAEHPPPRGGRALR
ncbi:MAG TPA: hypothetical protein VIF09_00920 [Polyangiaceae bacterium]